VSGRSHDRQRATFMSATGQLFGRLRAVSRVRCHPVVFCSSCGTRSESAERYCSSCGAAFAKDPPTPGPAPASAPLTRDERALEVNLTFPWLAFLYGLTRPLVRVDGVLVARGWGLHTVGLPRGVAQVSVHVPYLGFRVGKATFTSEPGGPAHLEYRPPYLTLLAGDIGVTARSRGATVLVALCLVALFPGAWVLFAALQLNHEVSDLAAVPPAATAAARVSPAPASTMAPAVTDVLADVGPGVTLQVVTTSGPFAGELGPVVSLLERRLSLAGITGVKVGPDGSGYIVAQFPNTPDPATVSILNQPVLLAFRPVLAIADPKPFAGDTSGRVVSDHPTSPSDTSYYVTDALAAEFRSLDCTPAVRRAAQASAPDVAISACQADGGAKYLLGPVEIEGSAVAQATITSPKVISMEFNAEGASAFRTTTQRLQGLPMPQNQFAMFLDGEVVSAPSVAPGVVITDGKVQMSGSFPNAGDLAGQIMLGAQGSVLVIQSLR
jgi:hypothetical protein